MKENHEQNKKQSISKFKYRFNLHKRIIKEHAENDDPMKQEE
jgi:hypothetical protein